MICLFHVFEQIKYLNKRVGKAVVCRNYQKAKPPIFNSGEERECEGGNCGVSPYLVQIRRKADF